MPSFLTWVFNTQTQALHLAWQVLFLPTKPSSQPTSHLLTGISLQTTIKLVCQPCSPYVVNSPNPGIPSLIKPIPKKYTCPSCLPGLLATPSINRYLYGMDGSLHHPLRWLMDSSEQLFPDSTSQGHSKDVHDLPLPLRSPKGPQQ